MILTLADFGITGALIVSSLIAAGGGIAAAQLGKPDFPPIPQPPSSEEIATEAEKRKRKVIRSQVAAAQRLAALGPIQLEAPALGI